MQMVGAQVEELQRQQKDRGDRTYFRSLSLQAEIPVSWQLQGHFASGPGEQLLNRRVCLSWHPPGPAELSLGLERAFPFKVASRADLGLGVICQHVSPFFSDARSNHLCLGDGTQAPTRPHPQPPGAGTSCSVHPASLAFTFARSLGVDTRLCVMGSKAPG